MEYLRSFLKALGAGVYKAICWIKSRPIDAAKLLCKKIFWVMKVTMRKLKSLLGFAKVGFGQNFSKIVKCTGKITLSFIKAPYSLLRMLFLSAKKTCFGISNGLFRLFEVTKASLQKMRRPSLPGTSKISFTIFISLAKDLFIAVKKCAIRAIEKVKISPIAGISRIKIFLGILVKYAVKIILSPITIPYALLKLVFSCIKKICHSIKIGIAQFFNGLGASLAAIVNQASPVRKRVAAVVWSPAVVLSLGFTVVAFLGLKTYDRQISKIEYNRAALEAHRAKKLLKQRQHVAYNYFQEKPTLDSKDYKKTPKVAVVTGKNTMEHSELQKTVDEFFCNHRVSEVMCEKGLCKIKVDGNVLDEHSVLGSSGEIYIFETDGEHITFADAFGNKCVKSIDSLFD
jgi:hypothetical protein